MSIAMPAAEAQPAEDPQQPSPSLRGEALETTAHTDPRIEATVARHQTLALQVNKGDHHRITKSGLRGSLWVTPLATRYKLLPTGDVATAIHDAVTRRHGPRDGQDQSRSFWYIDRIEDVEALIHTLGRMDARSCTARTMRHGEAATPAPPPPVGRLRHGALPETDRNYALAIHLSPFIGFVGMGPFALIIPLVLWLIRRDRSAFVDDHGREMLNAIISYFLYSVLLFWTFVVPTVLLIVAVINMIRGAVAASNREYFRYPLTIRFLS